MAKKLPRWCKDAKMALIERDMTAGELADALGMSKPYVYSTLNGKQQYNEVRKKISDYLNIQMSNDL